MSLKVISFCLYGTKAMYIIGMKENILLAEKHFPEWTVRIHYNDTVDEKYIKEFKELGAECILKENLGKNKFNWEGMFWRWLPLDDPTVSIWISRDADSRLSEREAKLVKEWEASGKTLHCIRDHRCHMHFIMGGLFGINNTLFHSKYKFDTVENIITKSSSYYKERPYNVDQEFLNDKLWNILKNDEMAHIANQGRRVYEHDIEILDDAEFMGKQYRIDDFPENKLKYLNGKKGCYWKKLNSSTICWSNSTSNISNDIEFSSEGEFYKHRVEHGYPQNWSQINILDGVVIRPKTGEDKVTKTKSSGFYWKHQNSSNICWSNSADEFDQDILFTSENHYFTHRAQNGFPHSWSQIKTYQVDTVENRLNDPLVSIAISTYEANGKGKELLRRNLENIHMQNYHNIEVIVSDHSSDHEIKNLCNSLNSASLTYFTYPIKYIHNPEHKGNSSQNTNNAIEHCSGEYIKILFMDDYLYNENAICDIVQNFQLNPDKKWLVHSYIHTKNYKDFYNLHHPKFSNDMIFCNRIGCPSCVTIHKSVKERFDENLKWFMDSEFYSRLRSRHNEPIILHTNANEKAYMVNVHHDNQVTNTTINNNLINDEKIYIRNKGKQFAEEKDQLNLPELKKKLSSLHKQLKLKHGNWKDEYDEQILSVNYIKPDSCVLELGGNIGRNSMIISLLLKDPTKLVVIEPSEHIYSQLMENKKLNNLTFNSECCAVSERKLWTSKWNTYTEHKPDTIEVTTMSFRELNDKYDDNFDVLVCDCEGALYYILQDNESILTNIKTIIIENDFPNIQHKTYVDNVFHKYGLKCVYEKKGDNYVQAYLPCKNNFYEVWQKPQ